MTETHHADYAGDLDERYSAYVAKTTEELWFTEIKRIFSSALRHSRVVKNPEVNNHTEHIDVRYVIESFSKRNTSTLNMLRQKNKLPTSRINKRTLRVKL